MLMLMPMIAMLMLVVVMVAMLMLMPMIAITIKSHGAMPSRGHFMSVCGEHLCRASTYRCDRGPYS